MARWAGPGDRRTLDGPIRQEDTSMSKPKRHLAIGTTSLARAAWAIVIAGLVGACGASPASPPPSEPHTAFAPLEVKVIGGPDWLVSTAGSLWVKRDDGHVNRIDPASGDVEAEIVTRITSTDGCNGLGVSAGAVWTCSASDLVRIDPETNEVTGTIPVGKVFSQGRLVEAAGQIWVLIGKGDQLVGVATDDNTPGTPVALPVPCTDLAVADGVVYANCTDADTVLRFDPASGSVTAKATVQDPMQISAASGAVWVAGADGLVRLDPESLAVKMTVPGFAPGWGGGIRAGAADVWVRESSPFLTRVDAATGASTRIVSAPYGPGDVLVEGDRVWTSDNEGSVLVRLTIPAS
jgi:outer membrane protein assembly factor BamB